MTKILVRAKCIFGGYGAQVSSDLKDKQLAASYDRVEEFLRVNARNLITQKIDRLPYINEGIISGPNSNSRYFLNKCIIINHFISGNGFNFEGVYHTLISAGLNERDIEENFKILRRYSGHPKHWKDNLNFKKRITIEDSSDSLENIMNLHPDLLSVENLCKK